MCYEFRLLPRPIPSSGIGKAAIAARSRYRIEMGETSGLCPEPCLGNF